VLLFFYVTTIHCDLGDDEDEEDDDERGHPWRSSANDMRLIEDEDEDEDDDGDDGDDEEDDDDDGDVREEDGDAEGGGDVRQADLRRQMLVENLIGMGFPIEWALRACENCDSAVNESVAIAWIIERMELEQVKMEGYSANSSRHDGEDFDDHGGSAIGSADAGGGGAGVSLSGANNGGTSFSAAAANIRERLGRIEFESQQHGISSDELAVSALANSAAAAAAAGGLASAINRKSSFSESSGGTATGGSGTGDLGGGDNISSALEGMRYGPSAENSLPSLWLDDPALEAVWNDELSVPCVLHDRESKLRRRHEQDKQEVLSQITELDGCEMAPITTSCQLALCIFYARKLVVRALSLSIRRKSKFEIQQSIFPSLSTDPIMTDSLVLALKTSFGQAVASVSSTNSLFPFSILTRVNSADNGNGDTAKGGSASPSLTPFCLPFTSSHALCFHDMLTKFERRGAQYLAGSLSVEEAPNSTLSAVEEIVVAALSAVSVLVDDGLAKAVPLVFGVEHDSANLRSSRSSLASTFKQLVCIYLIRYCKPP
jgi:hypothetical protein